MTETVQQPADMIARLGRKWGWVLAYGIITLAAGVAVLIWPSETLLVIAVLFGIQLIVSGIFRFVAALLGIFWVVNGAIELFTALSHSGMPQRGWTAFMGVLSIIAGIIVLAYPGLTLLGLAVILGIWLVILGVMECMLAWRLRSIR